MLLQVEVNFTRLYGTWCAHGREQDGIAVIYCVLLKKQYSVC